MIFSARSAPPSSPFGFDLPAQTFPSLCLLLLPPPPTLFSTSPFPDPAAFPLEAPGPGSYEAVQTKLMGRVFNWKWDSLAAAQRLTPPKSVAANLVEEHERLTTAAQRYEETAYKHLELAYQSWLTLDDTQRMQTWRLELARALVKEQVKRKDIEDQLERIQVEANQLQSQVEYLSRCQWPREMALWPPERTRFGKDTFRDRNFDSKNVATRVATGGSADRWDLEKLVRKWKRVVQEDKVRRTGILPAHQIQGLQESREAAPSQPPEPPPPLPRPQQAPPHQVQPLTRDAETPMS